MSKSFFHQSGKTIIYEAGYLGTGTNNLINYPLTSAYAPYLYFHSDYSFLRSPVSLSINLTLPARNTSQNCGKKKGKCVTVPAAGNANTLLFSGNYANKIIIATDSTTGRSLCGTMWVQKLGDSSMRMINIYGNVNGIYLEEQFFAYSNNLPAINMSIKIYVLPSASENRTTNEKLFIDKTHMRSNNGLFNSDLGYIDVNIDSVTYSDGTYWSNYYSSWNASLDKPDPHAIRRYVVYDPGTNMTYLYWDAFVRYDGSVEGIYLAAPGNQTSGTILGIGYQRGPLVDTKYVFNRHTGAYTSTVNYYVYSIRRQVPGSTPTRSGGIVFPNGPTLNVATDPGGAGAGMAYSFDGVTATYGDSAALPSNTVYNLNLL